MKYLIVFLWFNCLMVMNLHTQPNKNCLVIGHRGACGYAPENTISSIKKALSFGVDMIEFDVHCCKTGQLIVLHDNTIDRTTNETGNVKDISLDELQALTIEPNEYIPTLHQVLDTINRTAIAGIELKSMNTALPTAKIIKEYLAKGWQLSDFCIISFDHYQLEQLREKIPNIAVCANIHGRILNYAHYTHQHKFDAIGINAEYVTQEIINQAHDYGILVFVYTVNNEAQIQQLITMGVDGIFSDYPDRIQKLLP